MKPAVTVVLATYGRPGTLACAVQSVLLQTMPHWRLLVIGDGCGDETAAAMEPFLSDPRIRYVNLPWRCGEQAQPNSAGMACAQTERIAFLNHDDLWLPSHLEAACRELDKNGADFFIGRSAWVWEGTSSLDTLPPIATVSPPSLNFNKVFLSGFHCVEPVSAWVITRKLAEKVGPWRSSAELFRPPIQDWVLRACRAGARLLTGIGLTSIKFENQWSQQSPQRRYDTSALPQEAVLQAISNPARLQELSAQLSTLLAKPGAVGYRMDLDVAPIAHPDVQRLSKLLVSPSNAAYFLKTGLDSYAWLCAELGLVRGMRWHWALKHRTGEENLTPPRVQQVTQHVAQALREQGWNDDA